MKTSTNRTQRVCTRAALAILLISALGCATNMAFAAPKTVTIVPPDAKYHGKTYPEWHAAFWQYALSLPLAGHPFLDTPEYDFSAGLQDFRFESPQFEFTAPTPWIFGNFDPGPNVGGTGTAVGDGYFLMVELPIGQHTIHFGGTYHFETGELGNDEPFDLPHDITMEVTVGK